MSGFDQKIRLKPCMVPAWCPHKLFFGTANLRRFLGFGAWHQMISEKFTLTWHPFVLWDLVPLSMQWSHGAWHQMPAQTVFGTPILRRNSGFGAWHQMISEKFTLTWHPFGLWNLVP